MTSAAPNTNPHAETKHEKFLRLMQKRLGKALETLRLISQLSSINYINTDAEALEVVLYLDEAVHQVASSFEVPYFSALGEAALRAAENVENRESHPHVFDEIDAARLIEMIQSNNTDEALSFIRSKCLSNTTGIIRSQLSPLSGV